MSDTTLSSSMSLDDFFKSPVVVTPSIKGKAKSAARVALEEFLEGDEKFTIWANDTMPRHVVDGNTYTVMASYKKAKAMLSNYVAYRDNLDLASEILWYQDNDTNTIYLLNLRNATTEEINKFKDRQPSEVKGLPKV